jgi:hypothetical protein
VCRRAFADDPTYQEIGEQSNGRDAGQQTAHCNYLRRDKGTASKGKLHDGSVAESTHDDGSPAGLGHQYTRQVRHLRSLGAGWGVAGSAGTVGRLADGAMQG